MEVNFDKVKSVSKIEDITPMNLYRGVMYPDTGGHTGFFLQSYGAGMLYGRFFVFGILYKEVNVYMINSQTIINIFNKWGGIIDKITSKQKELWQQPGRRSMHVSEVFFQEDIDIIKKEDFK